MSYNGEITRKGFETFGKIFSHFWLHLGGLYCKNLIKSGNYK